MERLALAVFDIKPLQFSLEKKKRKGGVEKKKKKKKESCAPLCENVRRGGKVSLPFFLLRQFQDLERKEINA